MRNLILILLFFFLVFTNAQDQKITHGISFYYQLSYSENSDTLQLNGREIFVLNINKEQSVFSSLKNLRRDSALQIQKAEFDIGKTSFSMKGVPRTSFTYYIEKVPFKQEVRNYDQIGGKNFIYHENSIRNQWKLSDEKKVIGGFECRKATISKFGRNFIAWYTTLIPISDGPYKFFGLPGLILQVYDETLHFNFSLVKYDPNENIVISVPNYRKEKAILTDKKRFVDAKKNYNNNVVEMAKGMGLVLSDQRAKELQEKNNKSIVPLEIEY